jgi:M6 family metalloprotease-like protein
MRFTFVAIFFISISVITLSQKKEDRNSRFPKSIDPQIVQDQDSMTWDDYHPIPGKNWADPSLVPERKFKMALVAVDFPDQPFVITLPKHSDPFGNPRIDPVKREDVPHFYSDFWLKPSEINHGQTINGYWMEQSRGKFGITALDAFGPYCMPKNLWEYGLNEWGQNNSTPDGSRASSRIEPDADALWKAAAGDIKFYYDAILRVYAGYDETGVWQEFGEMKFLSKDDIPAEWGNPDTTKPRWIPTRYVPWTSWKAGQMQWGLSSVRQGENSGTITHELGHYAFETGDNNNNPYIQPFRRVGSGPWDMMDRGSFNGPGGPHMRWVVPPAMGASMPAGLMLRNRIFNGFLDKSQVLELSREELKIGGPVVTSITARAVEPLPGTYAGLIVRLDGEIPHDRTPADDPALNPLSPGIPNYDFYSVEVVQRIGYDSFCPDNGVLLAKNKDEESRNGGPNGFNCFNWVIDAHPEDINKIDYIRPDGIPVMRTIADYRQLNDALFHAGTNSGSLCEWIDEPNRLHFYIIDLSKNEEGILVYTVGVRSLDGNPAKGNEIQIVPPAVNKITGSQDFVSFLIKNVSSEAAKAGKSDIYRLSAGSDGKGWHVHLLNSLIAPGTDNEKNVDVFVYLDEKCSKTANILLTLRSESDPVKVFASSFRIKAVKK